MYCEKCGKELKAGVMYCSNCGNRVGKQTERTPFLSKPSGTVSLGKNRKAVTLMGIAVVILLVVILISVLGKGNVGTQSFAIEGKWKNISSISCGQIQPGGILTFNGTTCNFISPMDTYAFYKSGNKYYLDLTVYFAGDAEHWEVTVTDKNHITITDGGNYTLKFEKVG